MSVAKLLGAGALVLGITAPFAGSPYLATRGMFDVDAVAGVIAEGKDHIDPLLVAQWIRERRSKLRIVDVRSPQEFAEFSIPTAENVPLDSLTRASFAPNETLVLYSEGSAHAAQGAMVLRAMGLTKVYFISGGLVDWYRAVMSPTLCPNATDEQRAEFERTADLSRYFGGVPQLAPSCVALARDGTTPRIASVRRRGC